jgi:hydroxymethylpyrimidine/phosphomethylpyrimidine kinase
MVIPVVLTIAGSDSSGGAGIQADLKTFAALDVFGASAITAVTAQNTKGVAAIHDVPADIVAAQINAVFDDLDVLAVKVGMVSQPSTIRAIVEALRRWKPAHIVVDPVMISTSGARLLSPEALALLRGDLIPLASVLTPNLPEAAVLLDTTEATTESEMLLQAKLLLASGAGSILLKGGHGAGAESVDYLVSADHVERFAAPRIATRNTHGTGCSLSSAVAAGLARGFELERAVREAKAFVTASIAGADALGIGHGNGPIDHFHKWRER